MRVAIILPVYNSKVSHLAEAISSTFTDQIYDKDHISLSLIIIDDGSTDQELLAFLQSLALENAKVVTFPQNKGLAAALNAGMKHAVDCDFVVRMDSDDISVKERIQTQVDFMEANEEVDVCGSSVILFADHNPNLRKAIVHPTHHSLIKQDMLFYCCLAHPSLIIRNRVFPRICYTEE